MHRPFLLALALALLAPLMSACRTSADSAERHTHTLRDASSLLAVDVENFRGSVEVRVDRSFDEIVVDGYAHGAWFETDPRAEEEAPRAITLDTWLEEGDGVATLRVRTRTTREATDHEVAIVVRTPDCDATRVVNRGGLVELIGTDGPIDIDNREGHVEIRTDRPLNDDAQVLVVDGTVYMQIPPGSTGAYDLETLDGKVRFKNRDADATDTYSTRDSLQTILEEPSNSIVMRTNYGDLAVLVMQDPIAYTRVIRGRDVDFTEGLFLQGSRRYTRNLPDDEPRDTPPGRTPF